MAAARTQYPPVPERKPGKKRKARRSKDPILFDRKGAAEKLTISTRTLDRHRQAGLIRSVYVTGTAGGIRFHRDELERFAAGLPPSPEHFAQGLRAVS